MGREDCAGLAMVMGPEDVRDSTRGGGRRSSKFEPMFEPPPGMLSDLEREARRADDIPTGFSDIAGNSDVFGGVGGADCRDFEEPLDTRTSLPSASTS